MQGGDDGQTSLWFQRFARQNSANRMGDGVMHVQEIEILVLGYCCHLGAKRERVWLMLEQGIGHHLDFVKTNAVAQLGESSGQGRRNEVDHVTASGQLLAQFRTHNAAAAIGWVNSNADIHIKEALGFWSFGLGLFLVLCSWFSIAMLRISSPRNSKK